MALPTDAGEDAGMRRRRLRYRAWHRGTRELDLMLGPFADAATETMTSAELDGFEALLSEEDTSLQVWLMGQDAPPAVHEALIATVAAFKRTFPNDQDRA